MSDTCTELSCPYHGPANRAARRNLACLCCGRTIPGESNPRQPLHLDCWTEHHSDPTGVWPPDHECELDGPA